MPNPPQTCPRCGALLERDAHLGLCPACLIANSAEAETELDDSAPNGAPTPEVLGQALPEYEVLEVIGQGGMGTVYRAREFELDREVAIKLLARRPDKESADAFAERFAREAQVTAQLDHPAIVPVHTMGYDAEGRCFYTMRLVRGRDYSKVIALVEEGGHTWNLSRALDVLVRVCQAVAYAHAKGVIHRDLKPPNIMVGDLGEVYVLDWGLAKFANHEDLRDIRLEIGAHQEAGAKVKLSAATTAALRTVDGAVIGTPAYMSPEQAAGKIDQIDHLADVYSLGAMLYHLLARHPPYMPTGSKSSPIKVLSDLLESPPEKLPNLREDAPLELVAICDKAMARDRPQRYASALALAEDIQAYLDGRVVGAYESGGIASLRKWVIRNRALATAALVALVCLVAGLAGVALVEMKSNKEISATLVKEREAKQLSQRTLVASYVNQGLNESEALRYGAAGLWFAHAAIAGRDQPELRELNRQRFEQWYAQTPRLLRAYKLPATADISRLDFHPTDPSWLLVEHAGRELISLGFSIINLETGNRLRANGDQLPFLRPQPTLTAGAWHPKSPLAALSDTPGEVTLWNLAENKHHGTITVPGEPEAITALAWAEDGSLLFISGRTSHLWEAESQAFRSNATLSHTYPVMSAAFSSDGRHLLTSMSAGEERSSDHLVSVFDLGDDRAARPLFPPVPHRRVAWAMPPGFTPLGERFFTTQGGTHELREVRDGSVVRTHKKGDPFDIHSNGTAIFQIWVRLPGVSEGYDWFRKPGRISADGTLLADVENARLLPGVLDAVPRVVDFFGKNDLDYVAFSSDSTRLATSGDGSVLRIFDIAYDVPVRFVPTKKIPGDLLISPNGKWVVGKGHQNQFSVSRETDTLQVLEVATGQLVGQVIDTGAGVIDSAFSSEGSLIALLAGGHEGEPTTLQIHDWQNGGGPRKPTTLPSPPREVTFTPGNRFVVVLFTNGQAWQYPLEDGSEPKLLFTTETDGGHIERTGLEFAGTTLVAWGLRDTLLLWNWEAGQMITEHHTGIEPDLAISSEGVIGWQAQNRIPRDLHPFLSAVDGTALNSALDYRYIGAARRSSFSGDGQLYMISGFRDIAKIWDWRTGESVGAELRHLNANAEFVPHTRTVLTVAHRDLRDASRARNQARLHHLDSGQLIAPPIEVPSTGLWGLVVTPDGKHAVTADIDAERPGYHLIDLENYRPNTSKTFISELSDDALLELAELTACARLENGTQTRLDREVWMERWQAFTANHPELLGPLRMPQERLERWHGFYARRCEQSGQAFGAAWHREKLEALRK